MAGTQNQPLEYEQVTYNAPDGAQVGKSSTEKVAFWGGTPALKNWASVNNISTTASASTAGIYGFATSTETLQVTAALSTIIIALKALNIIT